ncbi:MAG TPA: hypothetical protein PK636_02860 [bacterium]|nr:hypothetical protein [bacterium]HPJ71606.1 hypothetical protein [bacterium]HPQ65116.1 hypothetical protein [bacterium]
MSPEGDTQDPHSFSPPEWRAIEVHRYFLSQRFCRFVSMEETIQSWLNHHSQAWRETQVRKATEEQLQEIEKHKWIESEKAGCDLGNIAMLDWINKYAESWRRQWERNERYNRETGAAGT